MPKDAGVRKRGAKAERIAVLVSGGGTNLQALIDAQQDGRLGPGRLTLVLSSSDKAYALERAQKAGISSRVLRPADFPDRVAYTDALVAALQETGCDLIVLAGFMYVLSPAFCEAFRNRVINVHPSLIPAFCGMGYYGLGVHKAALERGVKLTGATVHFVNEQADGGPIILQKAVKVRPGDTPELLQRRVMREAEWDILPRAVRLFCQGKLSVEKHWVRITGQ